MAPDDMCNAPLARSAFRPRVTRLQRGFTLIEVMIVVAIVSILAAVAIPSYRDYILRGQLVDGTTILSVVRADMERYYQDNRQYTNVGVFVSPCNSVDPKPRTQGNFTVTCAGADLAANSFKLTATGINGAAGFSFTINEKDQKTTATVGSSWPMPSPNTCWAMKRGQVCN
ncbi:MAG: type IV pilin protein [Burkholderiales bacterium]